MNPNDSSTPAIVAENLTKVYGSGNTEVVAMNDVSLRVARGEVIALLGPSGAGKSTLLTAIGLINPPTAGRISHRRRIGHGRRPGRKWTCAHSAAGISALSSRRRI